MAVSNGGAGSAGHVTLSSTGGLRGKIACRGVFGGEVAAVAAGEALERPDHGGGHQTAKLLATSPHQGGTVRWAP